MSDGISDMYRHSDYLDKRELIIKDLFKNNKEFHKHYKRLQENEKELIQLEKEIKRLQRICDVFIDNKMDKYGK